MTRFLVRRIGQSILVLFISSVVVFGIYFVGPGPNQVARQFAGRLGTAARIAQIKHELHLDQPIYLQYSHWAWNLLHGNFGYDYYKGQSVSSVIAAAAPATISLVIGAAIIWIIYGVFTGVISAVRSRSLMDRSFTASALFFYSMPTFVLGPCRLILDIPALQAQPGHHVLPVPRVCAHHLRTRPSGSRVPHPALADPRPGVAATYTRLTRASMLEVLGRGLHQNRPVQRASTENRVIHAACAAGRAHPRW